MCLRIHAGIKGNMLVKGVPWPPLQRRVTQIKVWISKYIRGFLWDLIIHPYPNYNSGLNNKCMDYTPLSVHVGVITYPCPKFNGSLANLC